MFIVYHIASTMEKDRTEKEFLAKRWTKKHNDRAGKTEYAYTTAEDYNKNVVYMREVTNLMTGKKVMEPSNTPSYCSVASEAYWSS